jgi:hypothetical protein
MIRSPRRIALLACAIGCASCSSTLDNPSTDHHTVTSGTSGSSTTATGAGGASATDTTGTGNTTSGGSGGDAIDAGTTGTGGGPDDGGGGGSGLFDAGLDAPLGPPPDFGPNVLIFDPTMPMAMIQSQIDAVIGKQASSQFGTARYAYFFKPGQYTLDVKVGFYMQVIGLGLSPDDVVITGAVRSKADWFGGNATLNFWRAAENLAVVPTQDANTDIWAVSQGTSLRRMHVKGPLTFSDGGYSSGGFIADSLVDGRVSSGTQQQFFSRNTDWMSWSGGVWNMVFVGAPHAPTGAWPGSPFTVVDRTPLLREKPYLVIDKDGHYFVVVPPLVKDTQGPSWTAAAPAPYAVTTDQFYIARPMTDTAATLNGALAQGKNLIFTPGIYHLDATLQVTRADTIVMGLGLTTLVPNGAIPAMAIADVDGVKLSGIIFDAGATESPTLLQVGEAGATKSHAADPTSLHDIFCRVGGGTAGVATSCLTINSNDVIADNLWLWRADHGAGAGWTSNRSKNGLVVNGSGVTVYGLFVEHFQEYQTLWNGEGGRVYFYQSEMPYDPPSQTDWQHDGENGYATYKVGPAVTTHEAWGIGMYSVFRNAVVLDNAMETPTGTGVALHHLITVWINGAAGSSINHIVNGTGAAATQSTRESRSPN